MKCSPLVRLIPVVARIPRAGTALAAPRYLQRFDLTARHCSAGDPWRRTTAFDAFGRSALSSSRPVTMSLQFEAEIRLTTSSTFRGKLRPRDVLADNQLAKLADVRSSIRRILTSIETNPGSGVPNWLLSFTVIGSVAGGQHVKIKVGATRADGVAEPSQDTVTLYCGVSPDGNWTLPGRQGGEAPAIVNFVDGIFERVNIAFTGSIEYASIPTSLRQSLVAALVQKSIVCRAAPEMDLDSMIHEQKASFARASDLADCITMAVRFHRWEARSIAHLSAGVVERGRLEAPLLSRGLGAGDPSHEPQDI